MTATPYDYLLAGILILLGVLILRVKDIMVGIVLFIIFGMFVALAWVQHRTSSIHRRLHWYAASANDRGKIVLSH